VTPFSEYCGVTRLIGVEDLGRRSTGQAWLCATTTVPRSAVCAIKFDNHKSLGSATLRCELNVWKLIYPDLAHMVSIQLWSGVDALVMPHSTSLLVHERKARLELVRAALTERRVARGKVHNDVREEHRKVPKQWRGGGGWYV
jgi:hypothetical protein